MNSNRGWLAALAVAPILFVAGLAHADEADAVPHRPHRPLCDPLTTPEGHKRCHAHAITDPDGTIHTDATATGMAPADLASAYGIPSTGPGAGLTVGIVDSNDDTSAEADLAVYRSYYNLPACTTANGCFRKVNQNGETSPLPTSDSGWAGEISLDLDMVSAVCPSCKILLVEADDATNDDLGTALVTAIKLGATAVSNSYGGAEDTSSGGDSSAETSYFSGHPGILITVSAGDDGYGAQFPATSPSVLAIGGTLLTKSTSTSRGWTETVWGSGSSQGGGTGSGCTANKAFTKPSWQSTIPSGCTLRMESDVSANADPNSGVATYCSTGCGATAAKAWVQVGGTSEASPIVASLFTLLGVATRTDLQSYLYANPSKFNDVTSGTNVISKKCPTATPFYCNGEVGYDGPTGLGTPISSALLQSGGTPVIDAGAPSGGKDAGTGTGTGGGTDAGSGTGTGSGDDSGTPTTGGGDDDSSGNADAGSGGGGGGGGYPSSGDDDDDAGGATTSVVDSGTGGSGFSGSGGSGASNGCSCTTPGGSSPVNEGGASLLALGAVAVFASRRRRRG